MLKFTSPTPTNSEIAKSVNKTEGSIRAHKKQHPEEIENINLKYKNSNYPFIKVEEYINFNNLELYEDDNLKDIEKESNKLTELILNKNIPGTIYKDGNNVSFTYIPPISKEIETIKNIFNENNIKKPISISIGNHKGGANKTTNTTNIAASLAYFGYKVLIVDFDPQGNA